MQKQFHLIFPSKRSLVVSTLFVLHHTWWQKADNCTYSKELTFSKRVCDNLSTKLDPFIIVLVLVILFLKPPCSCSCWWSPVITCRVEQTIAHNTIKSFPLALRISTLQCRIWYPSYWILFRMYISTLLVCSILSGSARRMSDTDM